MNRTRRTLHRFHAYLQRNWQKPVSIRIHANCFLLKSLHLWSRKSEFPLVIAFHVNKQEGLYDLSSETWSIRNDDAHCRCVSHCDEGFFVEGDKCRSCSPNCKSCIKAEQCQTCPGAKLLIDVDHYAHLDHGQCVDTCPENLEADCKCSSVSNSYSCSWLISFRFYQQPLKWSFIWVHLKQHRRSASKELQHMRRRHFICVGYIRWGKMATHHCYLNMDNAILLKQKMLLQGMAVNVITVNKKSMSFHIQWRINLCLLHTSSWDFVIGMSWPHQWLSFVSKFSDKLLCFYASIFA